MMTEGLPTMKRGLTYREAMAYVGVKRRQFDEHWRPQLVALHQGTTLVFDRVDLDRLFDRFKAQAAGDPAANDDQQAAAAQNGPRNGRPTTKEGVKPWAKRRGESTPTGTAAGKSTSGTEVLDFDSAVSQVMQRRKAG